MDWDTRTYQYGKLQPTWSGFLTNAAHWSRLASPTVRGACGKLLRILSIAMSFGQLMCISNEPWMLAFGLVMPQNVAFFCKLFREGVCWT